MRVVDHYSILEKNNTKAKRKKIGAVAISGLLVIGALLLVFLVRGDNSSEEEVASNVQKVSSTTSNGVNGTTTTKPVNDFYTGEQFQELYESLAFPNTQLLVESPEITGNKDTDKRIITIAESRGYELRSVPIFPIIKTNEPRLDTDDLLQPKAYSAWQKLQKQAEKDGIGLELNSGYRSVDAQRELFLQRLAAAGASTTAIANGSADKLVSKVLTLAAPPGYSRHHTGYTIDLFCTGSTGLFEDSKCFTWLSDDNYANAKESGWAPSYPDGVDDQGPEPEAWEYVWVGEDNV